MSDGTTAETVAAALSCTRSNGGSSHPLAEPRREDGRMNEMECMYLGLLGNHERLQAQCNELGRRLTALELESIAEGRAA